MHRLRLKKELFIHILLLLIAAFIALWYIQNSVFFRRHDQYDDTGYMLALFQQLAAGKILYTEAFSQYGPFFGMAWLGFFGITQFPIDHNHAGIGVCVLWFYISILSWIISRRITGTGYHNVLVSLWVTWSLYPLVSELGHPISLCAALVFTVVALSTFLPESKYSLLCNILAGAALAALFLTKINLGIFLGISTGITLLISWNRANWISALIVLPNFFVPFILIGDAWELHLRILTCLSVCIPAVLIFAAYRLVDSSSINWRKEIIGWMSGFFFTSAIIITFTLTQGVDFNTFKDGIIFRPLGMQDVFNIPPTSGLTDFILPGISVLLGCFVFFHLRKGEKISESWSLTIPILSLCILLYYIFNDQIWTMGISSLLWLPALNVFIKDVPLHVKRFMLMLTLASVWQTLGIYPVTGTQPCIPFSLGILTLMVSILSDLNRHQRLRTTNSIIVIVATVFFTYQCISAILYREDKHIRFEVKGADMFSLPKDQTNLFTTLVANLKNAEGPLFTFHGQNSLNAWADKKFLTGFNCTHISGILNEHELDTNLNAFKEYQKWSCVVYKDGTSFGVGPLFEKIVHFVSYETYPWFKIADYEVRLSRNHPPLSPVRAIWKENSEWKINAPTENLKTAVKWQLRLPSKIGNGQWDGSAIQTQPSSTDSNKAFTTNILPKEIGDILNSLPADQLANITFWLSDKKGANQIGLPLIFQLKKE